MHFDLRAPGRLADEVRRLSDLGAVVIGHSDSLVVMQDPAANEFCVE